MRTLQLFRSMICLLTVLLGLFAVSPYAMALPWDADLFKQQSYQTNELARGTPSGTVPVGRKPVPFQTLDEAEKVMKNPTPPSNDSLARGRRLYNANCWTCHGQTGDSKGPIGPQIGAPSLLTDFYRDRPDGRVFGIIHLGGTNMPRYGYKFSPDEIWDIVNYLRMLQGKRGYQPDSN